MKKAFSILILVVYLTGCKCPQLLAPQVVVSGANMNVGSPFILTAPFQNKATVYWTGPDATYVGNTWVRNPSTPAMWGAYSAKYVSNHCEKCSSPSSTVQVCPVLSAPIITVNPDGIYIGSTFTLSVPSLTNATVSWTGPGGSTSTANPWIINNATTGMSGSYTAKYITTGNTNCVSATSSALVNINDPFIYDPTTHAKYQTTHKGTPYNIKLVIHGQVGEVWLSPVTNNKLSSQNPDIPVMQLDATQTTMDQAAPYICQAKEVWDNGMTLTGCMYTVGSAVCIMGAGATDGATALLCTGIWEYTLTEGWGDCVSGVASIIAKQFSVSPYVSEGLAVVSASQANFTGFMGNMVSAACASAEAKGPADPAPTQSNPGGTIGAPSTPGTPGTIYPPIDIPDPTTETPAPPSPPTGTVQPSAPIQPADPGDEDDGGDMSMDRQVRLKAVVASTVAKPASKRILVHKLINNKQAAVKVAEAALFGFYGMSAIIKQRPYKVSYLNKCWVIEGNPAANQNVARFLIIINPKNGEIMKLAYE